MYTCMCQNVCMQNVQSYRVRRGTDFCLVNVHQFVCTQISTYITYSLASNLDENPTFPTCIYTHMYMYKNTRQLVYVCTCTVHYVLCTVCSDWIVAEDRRNSFLGQASCRSGRIGTQRSGGEDQATVSWRFHDNPCTCCSYSSRQCS